MARPGLALDRRLPAGPYDEDDHDTVDVPGLIDFGAVRVPVPPRGTVSVEPVENGSPQAVHITLPEGRLSVSALAAPKSTGLWPDLAREIDASLRESSTARVRSFPGDWGRELHATSGEATSVFVGVDGARWMLYGVATGPTAHARALDVELRRMLRGTTVVRGRSPYPVRTVLPLVVPETLPEPSERAAPRPGAGRPAPAPAPASAPARLPRNGVVAPVAPRAVPPPGRPVPRSAGPALGRPAAARSGAPVPGPVLTPAPATPYGPRPARHVGAPAEPAGPWTAPVPPPGWHAKPPGRRRPAPRQAPRPTGGPVPEFRPTTARPGSAASNGRRTAGPHEIPGAPRPGGGVDQTRQVGGRHAATGSDRPERPDAVRRFGPAPGPGSVEHAGRHSAPEPDGAGTRLPTGRPAAPARSARPGGRRRAPEPGAGGIGTPPVADPTSPIGISQTGAPSGRHAAPEPGRAAPPAPDGAGRRRRPG